MCCAFTLIGFVSMFTLLLIIANSKDDQQITEADYIWSDLAWTKNLFGTKPDFPYYGFTHGGVKDMSK